MNIWSSFRLVPPVAPEAMAWAVVSFATYLAATEFSPQLWGRALDPLALAAGVQWMLSTTKNTTSDRFVRAVKREPATAIFVTTTMYVSFIAVAVFASAAMTAKLTILFFMVHATLMCGVATFRADKPYLLTSTWANIKNAPSGAVMLEGLGLVVCALTLASVWSWADPMAFAAMMTFGVLVMRVLSNWVIVLYLLDYVNRAKDQLDKD